MPWTKYEILERANRWATKKKYMPLTEASLMEWKKEKIVPNPIPRGRGKGKGKAADWSCIAYYRILRIMQMRESGIIHRRDQRLILWFEGANIPIDKIRDDIIKTWEASLKKIHRQNRTGLYENLSENDKSSIPQKAADAILSMLKRGNYPPALIDIVQNKIAIEDTLKLITSCIYASLNPDYTGLSDSLNKLMEYIPTSIDKDIIQEEMPININILSGIAANVEQYDIELLNQLKKICISDENLCNIRDSIIHLMECTWVLKKVIPQLISVLPFLNTYPLNLMIGEFTKCKFELEDKFNFFIILLKRSDIRKNEGVPILQLAFIFEMILKWISTVDFKSTVNLDELVSLLSAYILNEKAVIQRLEEIENVKSN